MPSEILQINAKYNQSGAHNVGCAHGSAPTGALPWAQRCMRVDSSPWVRRSALTGAQLNATRLLWRHLAIQCPLSDWRITATLPLTITICLCYVRASFFDHFTLIVLTLQCLHAAGGAYSRPIGDLNLSGFWESSNFLQIAPPPSLYVWFSRNFAHNSVRCVTIRKKLWIRFYKFWF